MWCLKLASLPALVRYVVISVFSVILLFFSYRAPIQKALQAHDQAQKQQAAAAANYTSALQTIAMKKSFQQEIVQMKKTFSQNVLAKALEGSHLQTLERVPSSENSFFLQGEASVESITDFFNAISSMPSSVHLEKISFHQSDIAHDIQIQLVDQAPFFSLQASENPAEKKSLGSLSLVGLLLANHMRVAVLKTQEGVLLELKLGDCIDRSAWCLHAFDQSTVVFENRITKESEVKKIHVASFH